MVLVEPVPFFSVAQIRLVRSPWIIPEPVPSSGLQGMSVYIPDKFGRVTFRFYGNGLVSAPEELALQAVSPVVSLGVQVYVTH